MIDITKEEFEIEKALGIYELSQFTPLISFQWQFLRPGQGSVTDKSRLNININWLYLEK